MNDRIVIYTGFLVMVLAIVFLCQERNIARSYGRKQVQQEAVERGYGAFVRTNKTKVFIWNDPESNVISTNDYKRRVRPLSELYNFEPNTNR